MHIGVHCQNINYIAYKYFSLFVCLDYVRCCMFALLSIAGYVKGTDIVHKKVNNVQNLYLHLFTMYTMC